MARNYTFIEATRILILGIDDDREGGDLAADRSEQGVGQKIAVIAPALLRRSTANRPSSVAGISG